MYNYHNELKKVLETIDKLISRTHAGIINVPAEELDSGETGVDFMVKRILEYVADR